MYFIVGLTAAEPLARPVLTTEQKLAVAQKQLTEQQTEIAFLQAQLASAQKEAQVIVGRVNYQTAVEKLKVAAKMDPGCEIGTLGRPRTVNTRAEEGADRRPRRFGHGKTALEQLVQDGEGTLCTVPFQDCMQRLPKRLVCNKAVRDRHVHPHDLGDLLIPVGCQAQGC